MCNAMGYFCTFPTHLSPRRETTMQTHLELLDQRQTSNPVKKKNENKHITKQRKEITDTCRNPLVSPTIPFHSLLEKERIYLSKYFYKCTGARFPRRCIFNDNVLGTLSKISSQDLIVNNCEKIYDSNLVSILRRSLR
jgi:hypothetical protein